MLQEERCNLILEHLRQNQAVKVAELTELLNVSVDTIRRDLGLLDTRGLLRKVHGGAVLESETQQKTDYSQRVVRNIEKKKAIAARIVKSLHENEFIAVNSCTTNIEILRQIVQNFERMTVLTNNLRALDLFANKSKFRVIIPGGLLDLEEMSLYGRECEEAIGNYNIDTAIISTNAISTESGLTDFRYFETGVVQKMISSARRVLVAADSTKLERVASINVCDLSQIDALCTDEEASPKILEDFRKQQVEIL